MEDLQLELGCGGEAAGNQPGIVEVLPEIGHLAVIGVGQPGRAAGSVEQEDQPGQPGCRRLPELHLGVGDVLAWDDRAVPEPDDRDIDLAAAYSCPAVVRRPRVLCGEPAHVDRCHLGPADRIQGGLHERPVGWEPGHGRFDAGQLVAGSRRTQTLTRPTLAGR